MSKFGGGITLERVGAYSLSSSPPCSFGMSSGAKRTQYAPSRVTINIANMITNSSHVGPASKVMTAMAIVDITSSTRTTPMTIQSLLCKADP